MINGVQVKRPRDLPIGVFRRESVGRVYYFDPVYKPEDKKGIMVPPYGKLDMIVDDLNRHYWNAMDRKDTNCPWIINGVKVVGTEKGEVTERLDFVGRFEDIMHLLEGERIFGMLDLPDKKKNYSKL